MFDALAWHTEMIKTQTFLAEVIVIRILVFFELVNVTSKINLTPKSMLRKVFAILYMVLKALLVMVYL